MKKNVLIIFVLSCFILALENCKPEKTVTPPPSNDDPDSLYVGTKYTFTEPFNFPPIPASNQGYIDSLTNEGINLGRRIFYDKHFSLSGTRSCASCHQLQYAFSDSGNVFSTNEFGVTRRNAPALENMAWVNGKYFLDGRAATLAAQAQDAFAHELGFVATNAISYLQADSVYVRLFKKAFGRPGTITEDKIYKAVQEFMLSAVSANSKFDKFRRGEATLTSSEAMGYQLFNNETGDCFHCHMSEGGYSLLLTDNLFRNNGLDSAGNINDFADPGRGEITGNDDDYGKFRDPSLRNIALTSPYMHDGRYKTLMEVINFYSDSTKISPTIDNLMLLVNHNYGAGIHISDIQKQALVDYLNTLTDTSFINNPDLKDPF
ncbi:MAG TPA: cytochrome c peroxidase [Chitinophagales bacterium]|nr:cytochrome c peroxidase [Chitinophagales bacterium]